MSPAARDPYGEIGRIIVALVARVAREHGKPNPAPEAIQRSLSELAPPPPERGPSRAVRVGEIQRVVAARYGVGVLQITGASRSPDITRPRHIAMALAVRLTSRSILEIAHHFGRDNTTVGYAARKIARLRLLDQVLDAELTDIEQQLTAKDTA